MNLKAFGWHLTYLIEHDPALHGNGVHSHSAADCKGSTCAALNSLWNASPLLAAAGITIESLCGRRHDCEADDTWPTNSGLCVPAHVKALTLMVPRWSKGRQLVDTTVAQNLRWLKIRLDTDCKTGLCRALATDCPHLQHLYLLQHLSRDWGSFNGPGATVSFPGPGTSKQGLNRSSAR